MESLPPNTKQTSVEEAINCFDTEVNELLLQTTEETQQEVMCLVDNIKQDESIRKRSIRRHVLAQIKETILGPIPRRIFIDKRTPVPGGWF